MIWIILLLEMILYTGYIWVTYSPLKDQKAYPLIMVAFGLVTQLLWAFAAQRIAGKNQLHFYGGVWDLVISAMWLLVPLCFGVKLSATSICGLVVICAGLVLLKLG